MPSHFFILHEITTRAIYQHLMHQVFLDNNHLTINLFSYYRKFDHIILVALTSSLFASRTKIEEINQRKEEELKTLNIRIQKLQSDLMAANQVRPQ